MGSPWLDFTVAFTLHRSATLAPGVAGVEEDAVLEGGDAHGEGAEAPAAMSVQVLDAQSQGALEKRRGKGEGDDH